MMTYFFNLISDDNKSEKLAAMVLKAKIGSHHDSVFCVDTDEFVKIPGSPFAYWVSERVRALFVNNQPFESADRVARAGLQSSDDFRFLRAYWEIADAARWIPFAKGGTHSPYYADVYMVVNWENSGVEIKAWAGSLYGGGHWSRIIKNTEYYFLPGIFQTLRSKRLAPHFTPPGCIFGDNGSQAFCDSGNIFTNLAVLNSRAADILHKLLLGRTGYALYRNGTLGRLPVPEFSEKHQELASLALRAWKISKDLDSTTETSHAFLIPRLLRFCLQRADPIFLENELLDIQLKVDSITFELYDFSDADRQFGSLGDLSTSDEDLDSCQEEEVSEIGSLDDGSDTDSLRSWLVGVAFGRFDWRLATGEREAPPEPEPFDPLPAKSPGMLPDGAAPFHAHPGILADDPGHPHDLTRLTERVLERVEQPVPADLRRWLQREFFPFHLQRYSKSRRKAPLYWPLATPSGSYTLWLYYPDLSSQTLYTAVNDFLDGPTGKLAQVTAELIRLRAAGTARSRDDERRLDILTTLDAELRDLRDTLLQIAPTYQPNHDDGVQITAAPLWPLFRHKPWQKLLKETWTKLEKGDYDWAHLAMAYWPQRVREKCKTDKSLAIAHGLEDLYIEPEAAPKKTRGRKKKTST